MNVRETYTWCEIKYDSESTLHNNQQSSAKYTHNVHKNHSPVKSSIFVLVINCHFYQWSSFSIPRHKNWLLKKLKKKTKVLCALIYKRQSSTYILSPKFYYVKSRDLHDNHFFSLSLSKDVLALTTRENYLFKPRNFFQDICTKSITFAIGDCGLLIPKWIDVDIMLLTN